MFALINESDDISTQQRALLSCGNPLGGLENRDCRILIAHSCQPIGHPVQKVRGPLTQHPPGARAFLGLGKGAWAYSMTILFGSSESFCTSCAKELEFRRKGSVCHMKWPDFLIQGGVNKDTEQYVSLARGMGVLGIPW